MAASLRDKVAEVAGRIGADPNDLWHVIQFESKGNPQAVGPKPQKGKPAVGLIQFMEPVAKRLGTDRDSLLKMTAEQQLPYVEAYFKDIKDRHKLGKFSLRQLYSSVMAGNPHAPLTKGDGYHTIGQAVKTIEGWKKAEGTDKKPVEDTIGKLFGEKKPETEYPMGKGPLRPEVAQKEEQEEQAQLQQMPEVSPVLPRGEMTATWTPESITQKTVEQAQDMGMNVGDKEEPEMSPSERATRATWEFLHPGEPMPEGWSVEGEIEKIKLKGSEGEERQAVEPGDLARKYVGGEVTPGDWAKKYVGR